MKMYAKTKELGPIGGHALGTPPPDPPMSSMYVVHVQTLECLDYKCDLLHNELDPLQWVQEPING